MNQSASQNYQTQQIMTASPAGLVVLLYDKAMSLLNETAAAIERGDIEARHTSNRKAIDIIAHLWSTLDLEQGGEIAGNLNKIYSFMMERLADVDSKNDPQAARDVIALLDPLRKSWRQLAQSDPAPGASAAERPAAAPSAGGAELSAGSLSLSA